MTGPAQVLKGTVRTGDDSLRADLEYADLLRKGSQLQILAYDAKTLLKTRARAIQGLRRVGDRMPRKLRTS
jgi:hypothetical protein